MAAAARRSPVCVPGTTVNRLCGSGMDAVGLAARSIRAGDYELALAGGVESMTRAPFVMPKAESAFSRANAVYDTTIGWRFVNPLMQERYGVDSMPETAENVAAEYRISRADQDALRSLAARRAAAAAQAAGLFAKEIAPVTHSAAQGRAARHRHGRASAPRHDARGRWRSSRASTGPIGTVTAGNASGVNDGAAALIVASEAAAKAQGLTPRARGSSRWPRRASRRASWASARSPAVRQACWSRRGLTLRKMDVIELNEAFAAQALAVLARTRPARRRPARQSERRRHRARPSARHERRAARRRRRSTSSAAAAAATRSARCASASDRASR